MHVGQVEFMLRPLLGSRFQLRFVSSNTAPLNKLTKPKTMKLPLTLGAPLTSHVYSRIEAGITKKIKASKVINIHSFLHNDSGLSQRKLNLFINYHSIHSPKKH